jgi:hypothetical protein
VLCGCTVWKRELSFTLWQLLFVRKSSQHLLHDTRVWVTKLKCRKDECQCALQQSNTNSRISAYITLRFFHFINYVVSIAKSDLAGQSRGIALALQNFHFLTSVTCPEFY